MLEEGMMAFALLGAGWVLWLLVGLSVGVLAISVERWFVLGRDTTATSELAGAVDGFLDSGDTSAFGERLKALGGLDARILAAGVDVARLGPEAVEKAMSGTATAEKLRMERGLAFIATVGSNAPFLGLFGTVLGIIKAFHDLAQDTAEASTAVMAGISEALVATAVGLLVAIPAVVLYNTLSRIVKNRLARSASLADLVLARLVGEAVHGR